MIRYYKLYVMAGRLHLVRYVSEKSLFSVDTPEDSSTGDIIFNKGKAPVGEVGILEGSQLVFILGQRTMIIVLHPKKSNNQFFTVSLLSSLLSKADRRFSMADSCAICEFPDCGEILLMLHHFANNAKSLKFFLRGYKAIVTTDKLIAAKPAAEKSLDAAIAHRQKTLCWVAVKEWKSVFFGNFGF